MAANTDKFKKLSPKWVGNIGAAGVANGTVETIPLTSASNLATDTAVVATINRVDANGAKTTGGVDETIIGVVSGNNLINCVRGVEGTAQAHSAGQVVEILVTARGWNDLIDGILAEHGQDGKHTDATVTTLKATGAEINTGTEDAKIVTPKAIADSAVSTASKTETLTNKTLTSPKINEDVVLTATSTQLNNLNLGTNDGWISANESWDYASATTITVPSGAAAKYSVGDRIKWTQTTVKYGVITAVADTLLTIAVNTDYVVENAAITLNYYSHEPSPVGYPQWFTFAAPTMAASEFDDGAGGQPTISVRRFCITGRLCTVKMYGSGVKATTGFYCGTFSQSALPPIKTDYILGRTVCGTAYIYPNNESPVVGVIMAYTNGSFYALFHTNITDNTVIGNWSIIMSYEI